MTERAKHAPTISALDVAAYTIPTDQPESDGTLKWDATTLVLVEVQAGDQRGLGYSYTSAAAARLIKDTLAELVIGSDALSVTQPWGALLHATRNLGRPGIVSTAVAAIDVALWDLKAKLLDVALVTLLGSVRDGVRVYGSGGFTSYSRDELCDQLSGWAAQGIGMVKMKVGRDPDADVERVRAAREALGPNVQLFVDGNGAYSRKQALALAEQFKQSDVRWFEEPVSSNDLDGLRLIRDRAPAGMAITAGEYGYDLWYFRRMLDAAAVDVLQADGSRCGGITGFLRVDPLCAARSMPLSAHCCPLLHLHPACAMPTLRHIEYFHDHVRIEQMLFDGMPAPVDGVLSPDRTRPGLGVEFKRADAAQYAVAF